MSIPPALGTFLGKLVADQAVQAGAQQLAQNLVGRASQGTRPDAPVAGLTAEQLAAALAPLATRDVLLTEMQRLAARQERQEQAVQQAQRQGTIVLALLAAIAMLQLVTVALVLLR